MAGHDTLPGQARSAAAASFLGQSDSEPDRGELEELPLVMREISDAMGGIGAALTLHPDDQQPVLIYVDDAGVISRDLVARLLDSGDICSGDDRRDEHAWIKHEHGDALCVPVQKVPSHSRLRITIFFPDLDSDARRSALKVYTDRRPFAIGYFRLWQTNRANVRRIRASETALDFMELGVILLSARGEIVFANTSARAILNEGSSVREYNRHVRAASLAETVRLNSAIAHVLQASNNPKERTRPPLLALDRGGRPPLIISLLPTVYAPEEHTDVAAMLFLVDSTMNVEEMLQPICKAFQLSNVETTLATMLATGATLAEAAAALHVKEATARSYLKQIFAKTSTNRQADLVRVLLSSAVRVRRQMPFQVV